jgi:cephalosporin-C deacetylase-like acetyl esterase
MPGPGFLRCIATVERDGRTYRGLATAGFSPEKIKPTQIEPADFDAFWAKAKADLAALPLDPRLTPLPEESNDQVEVFQVSLQNVGTTPARSSRFYGILCVPRGAGPFPAMMVPPGAGIRKLHGQKTWAERGFLTLEVGVHGIPVILPEELYASLNGALGSYQEINLDHRDRYYFRRVLLGCLRANDYLVSHPKWDQKNLIDFGGSQGGYLSITTTALDPRVTALVAAFPAYCDVSGYAHGRAGGWPGMKFLADPAEPARETKLATTAYYDTVNFARRLKVPGHFGWGYNDETCPPTSTFSAYNVITSPKTLSIFKEMGHPRVPELTVRERDWVGQHGLKK